MVHQIEKFKEPGKLLALEICGDRDTRISANPSSTNHPIDAVGINEQYACGLNSTFIWPIVLSTVAVGSVVQYGSRLIAFVDYDHRVNWLCVGLVVYLRNVNAFGLQGRIVSSLEIYLTFNGDNNSLAECNQQLPRSRGTITGRTV